MNTTAYLEAKQQCVESIKQVMRGVFYGLRDLHSLGITHRDIKLSNILISNNRYPIHKVKICDLGSSKKLVSDPSDESTASLNYIGTRAFRAPELIVGNRYYDTKIDIWSSGIILLKLILVGYLGKKTSLFNVTNSKQLAKAINDLVGEPTRVELQEMLATNDLMSTNIKSGVTDEEILRKRFKRLDTQMANKIPPLMIDLLHKVLELSPKRRISAEEALKHPFFSEDFESTKKQHLNANMSFINRTTETTSPCPNTHAFLMQHPPAHN